MKWEISILTIKLNNLHVCRFSLIALLELSSCAHVWNQSIVLSGCNSLLWTTNTLLVTSAELDVVYGRWPFFGHCFPLPIFLYSTSFTSPSISYCKNIRFLWLQQHFTDGFRSTTVNLSIRMAPKHRAYIWSQWKLHKNIFFVSKEENFHWNSYLL